MIDKVITNFSSERFGMFKKLVESFNYQVGFTLLVIRKTARANGNLLKDYRALEYKNKTIKEACLNLNLFWRMRDEIKI